LLVSAFERKTYLPEGEWIDYWTGEKHKGPKEFEYTPPENRGGGLFVKAGAIIPMGPDIAYVGQKPDIELTLDIYPSEESEFVLYEDDGISYEYEKDVCARTLILVTRKSRVKSINIGARKGAYTGMPKKRVYLLKVRLDKVPTKVILNKNTLKKTADKKLITPAKGTWRYDNANKALWINIDTDAGAVEIS
jgi:alpha-glucosidase (family GH31 glycosyl hydrolase)